MASQDELKDFLDSWLMEIKTRNTEIEMPPGLDFTGLDKTEVEAALLYKHACKCEAEGDLTAALSFYQKAFRLVPDISENQVHNIAQRLDGRQNQPRRPPTQPKEPKHSPAPPRVHLGDVPAIVRQHLPSVERVRQAINDRPVDFIGNFAPEILLHIFSFLNPANLDTCGQVCARWHILSRDGELWKRHCLELWNQEVAEAELQLYNDSWRQLFLSKPHIHFDGVYVSKTSYVRCGEAKFGEGSRPVLVCQYFRYLRFLPNNTVFVLLSNKKPKEILSRFRTSPESLKDVLRGTAEVVDGHVLVEVLQGRNVSEYTLRIAPGNSKTRQTLRWESMMMRTDMGDRWHINQGQGPFYFVSRF
eukprot:c15027_g1_i2.p1 GENE.c15027_g1_i2~~c15027_g1_i2.p1  ORF type:complete len:384 (+),score=73.01 c15027_g1_i2:74-1153(+)